MDFVLGLPRTQKSYDSIWVVVDQLTKSARFIPFKYMYSAEDYATIFIDEILCHHGIPLSIILDRGAQFTQILEIISKMVGHYGEVEHCFSYPKGWTSGAYYTNP